MQFKNNFVLKNVLSPFYQQNLSCEALKEKSVKISNEEVNNILKVLQTIASLKSMACSLCLELIQYAYVLAVVNQKLL